VIWTEPAVADLNRLDNPTIDRIVDAVNRHGASGSGDIRRLQGIRPPRWRLRVGNWRVITALVPAEHTMLIVRVLPRGSAYRP
jgi:mRNA-degrading endonuclease RelE of RelBE toxin-antitoxin system